MSRDVTNQDVTSRTVKPNPESALPASRRDVMAAAVGLSAAALAGTGAAVAQTAAAPAAGPVNTRTVGKTGETLPLLGLGTYLTFDLLPGKNRDHLRAVADTYLDAGVRVVDTSPLYGTGEVSIGDFLSARRQTDEVFLANKIWSTGEYLADESHALRSFEQSQTRLWRERFDLLQCHSLVNVEVVVPILQAWKKEGRTRLVGVTHHQNEYHDVLATWIERGGVDFVQVNYSMLNRSAENRILKAAAERGMGVLINMPLDKGRLHKAVGDAPLPDFAREIGAQNWAQFFLKWVMGHPAVTTVLCATANPDHAAENVGALRGPLPDAAMRARMLRHVETLPGFATAARLPYYPDKQAMYQGVIRRSQAAVRQRQS